jgi:hypothetical protein
MAQQKPADGFVTGLAQDKQGRSDHGRDADSVRAA